MPLHTREEDIGDMGLTDSAICDVGRPSAPALSPATARSHPDAPIRVAGATGGRADQDGRRLSALGVVLSELLAKESTVLLQVRPRLR